MKLAALVSVLVSPALVASASARTVLLGRSWQGRPIRAVEVGTPSGTRVLVFGCVHGNETAGISAPVAAAVDRWCAIPLAAGVESLNVAVAGSLVLYRLAGFL